MIRPTRLLSIGLALLAGLVTAAAAPAQTAVPVDGMVGQVNGRAIYARDVFVQRHEQLEALGKSSHPVTFEIRARELIHGRLQEIVTDKLLLTEAERGLTERDEQAVQFFMKKTIEELIRKLGEGSRALAEQNAMEIYQKPLSGVVDDERAKLLIRRHTLAKLMPKIVIRRKDIERYYHDHYDTFNSDTVRIVRIIAARKASGGSADAAAAEIEKRLAAGEPFAEVARDESLNVIRAGEGGLWDGDGEIEGDNALGEKSSKILVTLKEGEYARVPGEATWIFVERIFPARKRTLRDAQLEIENILLQDQLFLLTHELRAEAFAKGNFTDIDEMTDTLVKIAMVRYYKPQTEQAKAFAGEK